MEIYLTTIKNSDGYVLEEIHSDSFNKAVFEASKAASAGDRVTIYEGEEDALGSLCNPLIMMDFTQDAYKDYDGG